MRLEDIGITQDSQAVPCWSSSAPEADYGLGFHGLQEERRWRHPAVFDGGSDANILASRWVDSRTSLRREEAESSVSVRDQLLHIIEPISGEVSLVRYEIVPDKERRVEVYRVWVHRE